MLESLFPTRSYASATEQSRASIIYGVSITLVVLYTLYAAVIPNFVLNNQTLLAGAASTPIAALLLTAFYLVALAAYGLTRAGRLTSAGDALILLFVIGTGFQGLANGYLAADAALTLPLLVLVGTLVLRERGLIVTTIIAHGLFFTGYALRPSLPYLQETVSGSAEHLFTLPLLLLGTATMCYLFLVAIRVAATDISVSAGAERLKLAQVSALIAQRISDRLTLDEVLTSAVEEIRQNYPNIYHAQIFLVDEQGRQARLAASTGEVGKRLIARAHSLEVGSQSVIGQVTRFGTPIVAVADSTDGVHRRNEFLPNTAVEAAFPLRLGGRIIGALDLQSEQTGTFPTEDLALYQSLADNIAVAIDNARLVAEAERQLEENRRLYERSQTAYQEIERMNRRLTAEAWANYLDVQPDDALSLLVDFNERQTQHAADTTSTQTAAIEHNRIVQEDREDARIVALPVRVRGQVIGAMEFELNSDDTLNPEDLALIEEVSERFGLAVENVRLVEETQRSAQREALVNSISTRLQSANDVEGVLTEAARSLVQTMRARRVNIRLGTPPAAPSAGVSTTRSQTWSPD